MLALRPCDMREVALGVPIASLAPKAEGVLLCRVNGEWLLPESWDDTRYEDIIEFYDVPRDRDTLRGVLLIGATLLLGPAGYGLQGLALAGASFAASLLINALLPPTAPEVQQNPGRTGENFSASLSGNEARLDQPIWKICGRREVNPPFAGQPYYEYRARVDGPDPNIDHDQYFYALYAVGVGNHEVVAKITNTPINRFSDVLRATYLPPGTPPAIVRANVTTASEVSGQVLESGRYVGGFAACAAQRTCAAIGIDIATPRGLGSGSGALTVSWRVEYRPINDFGQVLGAWAVLGEESRTAYTATPQRWSYKYEFGTGSPSAAPTAQRVEIRVVRTDVQDTDAGSLHELSWIGLRAYLAEEAPLNADTAHFEVVMRASSQLSNLSSRDLRLITKAYARTWSPSGGWGSEVHTRNPMWWALDLLSSSSWGVNKPTSRIDMQSFYDLAILAEQRQDRFDWTFETSMSAWDALQLIARTCRARVFRRNGVVSIARDELADTPVTAFTPRNCQAGMVIRETMRTRSSPDGVCIEYQDHRTWEWTPIYVPCPGTMTTLNPIRKRIEGITGATHAHREGLYEAYNLVYRPRIAQFVTEMQGLLPAYMSPVDFVADIAGYGSSGDVTNVTNSGLTLELSEVPDFSVGELYITLIRRDGTCTEPILVAPGTNANEVDLSAAPDFTVIFEDGTQERTKYLIGPKDMAKIISIEDGGKTQDRVQLYRLSAVIDDERVHTADIGLLPGPDEIQDPVGDPNGEDSDSGGGLLVVVRIDDVSSYATSFETGYTGDLRVSVSFGTTGHMIYDGEGQSITPPYGGIFPVTAPLQWNLYGDIEPTLAALYEIRATMVLSVDGPEADNTFTGTMNTWQALDTERTWQLLNVFTGPTDNREGIRQVRFEIRETATGIVQDAGVIDLRTFFDAGLGGGGA